MKSKHQKKSAKPQSKPDAPLPQMREYTPDEFAQLVNARMCEHFDGFVVLGFRADTGRPVVVTQHNNDHKTALALRDMFNNTDVEMPDES